MAACIYIPNKKGTEEPSKLFKELLKLTDNNREATKFIWALSQDGALMKALGFSTTEEPSAVELLKRLGNSNKLLDEDSYARYITSKEGLDSEVFSTYGEAFSAVQDLKIDYPNLVPITFSTDNGFKVELQKNSIENQRIVAKQLSLRSLNTNLINYIESLGFRVKEVSGLESPGMFSPLNAEENANGLKTAIRISKTNRGQEVLPEEFSHLLVAGFRSHPAMQRLLKAAQDDDIMAAILGEEYDAYDNKYNGDVGLLADEVAAKLIAQNLVERAGISEEISFISNKVLDIIKENLAKGDESYIDRLIREAKDEANNVISTLIDNKDAIKWFDEASVMSSSTMYHLEVKGKNLEQITTKAYETLSKRAKILSLSRKDGKLRPEDAKAFTAIKNSIAKKKYAVGCTGFLNYVLDDCHSLYESLDNIRDSFKTFEGDDRQLRAAFRTLRSIESALEAYSDIVKTLSSVTSNDEVMTELDEDDATSIQELAGEVQVILNNLNTLHDDMRKNSLFKFYQRYWGEDKLIKAANGELKTLTLEDILESSMGDISGFNRVVNSMADVADPLMQMVDMAYKDASNTRDSQIFALQQKLAIIQKRYTDVTGSRDTSWMYEKDNDGIPTGMFISDRDFKKYYADRSEYYQSLKSQGLDPKKISTKLKVWDRNHTEYVDVGYGRKEMLPRKSMYSSNTLDKLSTPQREFYNQFIELKKQLDVLIPTKNAHLYRAPQKKVSIKDSLLHKGNLSTVIKRYKDRYIKSVDDTEYGEDVLDATGKHIILDFGGKEVKKVPVYYTTWLDDKTLLDTNATDALLSYGAMAYNYTAMNSIANILEVTNSLMQDRKIIQTSGKRKLYEKFRLGEETFSGDYTIPGAASTLAKKLRNYIDSNVYDRKKEKEILTIRNKEINIGKLGDELKSYGSVVGLGYNLFSGMTNVTMGVAQTLLQSAGGEYFGFKDVAKAHILYNKELSSAIAGQYNDIKKDKLNLLIQKFDALEDYYQNLDDSSYNSGVFKKMIGKHNPLILNSMGEHYLHSISMISYLNKLKILVDNKKISMYDALVPVQNSDGTYELIFKEGAADLNGNLLLTKSLKDELNRLKSKKSNERTESDNTRLKELKSIAAKTDSLIFKTKLSIQQVNHSMHGAFNATDRGDINRNVIGRLAMQFRQWMPAFYTERFKGARYNMLTEQEEEGFYFTAAKFILGTLSDMSHFKFNIATRWKTMSNSERANVRKAVFEVGLLYTIGLILHGAGGPDKDDPWLINMGKYNLYRVKMELGAAAPTSAAFLGNVKTLIKSPIPVMENLDRIISLLDVTTMNDTIQSGKYAGWNRWLKNLYFSTPYVKNVSKFIDLVEGDTSMFTPYINTRSY